MGELGRAVRETLTRGLVVTAWVAVPDYATTRRHRLVARTGVLAVVAGSVLAEERSRQSAAAAESGPQPGPQPADPVVPPEDVPADPSVPGLLDRFGSRAPIALAAGVAAVITANVAGRALIERAAGSLSARGVRRPWTVVGAVCGVLVVLGDADDVRRAAVGPGPARTAGPAPGADA